MSNKAKATDMKEDGKPALVPKLRFPEFLDGGDWTIRPLGKVCKIQTGKKDANEGAKDGAYPFFTCAAEHIYSHSYSFDTEAILVAGNANVGETRYFNGKFEAYQRTYVLSDFAEIRVSYLYSFLSANLRSSLLKQVQVSAMSYIKLPMLLEYELSIPPSLNEQQKIAECLSSVDMLIAAQARKLDALKTHKKGLMQQLFPREGETQPRLRFPEFQNAEEWAEETLGDIVKIWSGNSPSKYAFSNLGKYAFVKVEDLNNCTKYQTDSREYCDYSEDAIPKNSVLFPKRGASIELNKIRITALEILIDTNLMALSPEKMVTVEFLYYFLVNVGLAHIADMSTIPQINNKHIIPFKILLPTKLEQESIAGCLTSLDDLITAQTQKLETLKTHKKGLMQQLFPLAEALEA